MSVVTERESVTSKSEWSGSFAEMSAVKRSVSGTFTCALPQASSLSSRTKKSAAVIVTSLTLRRLASWVGLVQPHVVGM